MLEQRERWGHRQKRDLPSRTSRVVDREGKSSAAGCSNPLWKVHQAAHRKTVHTSRVTCRECQDRKNPVLCVLRNLTLLKSEGFVVDGSIETRLRVWAPIYLLPCNECRDIDINHIYNLSTRSFCKTGSRPRSITDRVTRGSRS